METSVGLGAQLRRARLAAGPSARELARQLHDSHTAVRSWELGICTPPVDVLPEITVERDEFEQPLAQFAAMDGKLSR